MTNPDYRLLLDLTDRATRLDPEAQRVLSVAAIHRCLPLLARSATENELRRPVLPLAAEGLTLAWARCAGQSADPAGIAERLRAYGPTDPDDPILEVDSSVLPFVQDLPDLLEQPRLSIHHGYEIMSTYHRWYHSETPYGPGALFELAALLRDLETLERRAPDPDVLDQIRNRAIQTGTQLEQIVNDTVPGASPGQQVD
ncbi:hypothetical protein [Actinoplanes sp. L3-i22]|uniref:hypothetical protein n=1 Tax=Actinoplanes sp. L3-i22 TaxID=2836373 RepID=UPI001C78CFD3|nr:hypothetical protein [Actinoplanes sp. L3-i22]BCY08868.1 hypothetical protein L3i22_039560 [Actinoplanes sp. L3-i22]